MSQPIRFEADVKIRKTDEGAVSVLVNGEEMNMQILADSLVVTFPSDETYCGNGLVTMTLISDVDLDLPGEVEVK